MVGGSSLEHLSSFVWFNKYLLNDSVQGWKLCRVDKALPQRCSQSERGGRGSTRRAAAMKWKRSLGRKSTSSWGCRYEQGPRATPAEPGVPGQEKSGSGGFTGQDSGHLNLTCSRVWRERLEPDHGRPQILNSTLFCWRLNPPSWITNLATMWALDWGWKPGGRDCRCKPHHRGQRERKFSNSVHQ